MWSTHKVSGSCQIVDLTRVCFSRWSRWQGGAYRHTSVWKLHDLCGTRGSRGGGSETTSWRTQRERAICIMSWLLGHSTLSSFHRLPHPVFLFLYCNVFKLLYLSMCHTCDRVSPKSEYLHFTELSVCHLFPLYPSLCLPPALWRTALCLHLFVSFEVHLSSSSTTWKPEVKSQHPLIKCVYHRGASWFTNEWKSKFKVDKKEKQILPPFFAVENMGPIPTENSLLSSTFEIEETYNYCFVSVVFL